MLEGVKEQIEKLMALYENEKSKNIDLEERLQVKEKENESYRKQILELEKKVNNLTLIEAFGNSTNNDSSKKRIKQLIKDIDKCINLLEK